jgi:hypothetical protein
MKHHFEWEESTLNIRCWSCSAILISITTDGSSLSFDSLADTLEIGCPKCHECCAYRLTQDDPNIRRSHTWDSDVDSVEFESEIGKKNRDMLRRYKSLLLDTESTTKHFQNEFYILKEYFEFLSEKGIHAEKKDESFIDSFIDELDGHYDFSMNQKKLSRRAINRFYRLSHG